MTRLDAAALVSMIAFANGANPAIAGELTSICVTERVPLDRHSRAAFERELLALLEHRSVKFSCLAADSISVTVSNRAPDRYARALGIARKSNGRILPELELYLQPLILRLGHLRASGAVGRALARVAAHEVVHYLDQRHDHDEAGILQSSFTAGELAGYDRQTLMRFEPHDGAAKKR